MVVTFERPPRQVVHPDWRPELLTTLDEKIRLMDKTGIDVLVILRFNQYMAGLSAHDFMKRVLFGQLNVRLLLTGYDNRFGHNREEGFDDYVRYGQELGIEVLQLPAEGHVSSSLIRQQLAEGHVDEAAHYLGRHYTLTGHVTHGEHIGTQLGFPTANIVLDDPQQLIPLAGVYAVQVHRESDGTWMPGMMNIGHRPTFDGHKQTLEVNILGLNADLYGQRLVISFVARLRAEQRFESQEALVQQLQTDARKAEKELRVRNFEC
jgi:riboflavin kinase/FMN adenylyltransferase